MFKFRKNGNEIYLALVFSKENTKFAIQFEIDLT
jgi:hypothetical protein